MLHRAGTSIFRLSKDGIVPNALTTIIHRNNLIGTGSLTIWVQQDSPLLCEVFQSRWNY